MAKEKTSGRLWRLMLRQIVRHFTADKLHSSNCFRAHFACITGGQNKNAALPDAYEWTNIKEVFMSQTAQRAPETYRTDGL